MSLTRGNHFYTEACYFITVLQLTFQTYMYFSKRDYTEYSKVWLQLKWMENIHYKLD